jgi:phosphate/sulfate permease
MRTAIACTLLFVGVIAWAVGRHDAAAAAAMALAAAALFVALARLAIRILIRPSRDPHSRAAPFKRPQS